MKVFLAGISCVGKTAIGSNLAGRLKCPFFDLDREVERHFGQPLGRLRSRFLTTHSFRKECISPVIRKVLRAERDGDLVMALTPSSLMDNAYAALRGVGVVVVLRDTAENILARITFYDDDSQPINKMLTDEERIGYLKAIRGDIRYFGRSFRKADMIVDIDGLGIEQSAALVEQRLKGWPTGAGHSA